MLKKYFETYQKIRFERIDLAKAINEKYHPKNVLYPGSSIHISFSFIFQNVTYIDPSPLSLEFFMSIEKIKEFVNKESIYSQSPFIRFLNSKIEDSKEIENETFDLVFSSFSGNLIEASWKYVRYKGIYISNNHYNELLNFQNLSGASYIGYFVYRKGKYIFTESTNIESITEPGDVYVNNKNSGVKYLNNEKFYVIQKRIFA